MNAFQILNDNCWSGVLRWVPPESLLNCRLVCSTWRRVIDHQLDHQRKNRADNKSWNDLTTSESLQACQMGWCHNASLEQPFLERGTKLLFDAQDGIRDAGAQWKNSVLFQILDKFGRELWWVTLEEDMEVPPITYYQHLRKMLSKLPNLKGVQFDCALLRRKPWPTDCENPELARFIDVFPLPELPNLKSCRGYVTLPILDKYGPQLNYLKLEQPEDLTPAAACRLVSLRELKMNHVFPDTPLGQLWHLTTTSVEKLSIRLENRPSADDLGLWPIDQFLGNLRDLKTLKTLDITTCGPYIAEGFPISEDLKNNWVQNLTIRIRNGDKRNVFYNFLGCFTNLKFFSLRFEDLHPDELEPCEHPLGFEEMIWVRPFLSPKGELTDDLYQSNIWIKIPTLQRIELVYGARRRVYTRSQRQVYLENLITITE